MALEIQERRDASSFRVWASYRVTGRDTLGESSGGGSILETQWRLALLTLLRPVPQVIRNDNSNPTHRPQQLSHTNHLQTGAGMSLFLRYL